MKLFSRIILTACVAITAACGTPKNIIYFQDIKEDTTIDSGDSEFIKFKPMDQISVIVNSRDPQVTAMFNLPYYSARLGQSESTSTNTGTVTTGTQGISGYIVDSKGDIDFPILGKIHIAGLTREETADIIKKKLIESRQIKDPVVTVTFMNLGFSVLGEVNRPGRYKIDRDRFTIFDALALAGDLTINAERENVVLVRQEGSQEHAYVLNLLDAHQLYGSPAFNLQQGDVIYVKPNDKRVRESTINGNNVRSTSFWFSVTSMLTSVTLLVLRFIPSVN